MSSRHDKELRRAIEQGTAAKFARCWTALGRPAITPEMLAFACACGQPGMVAAVAECGGRFRLPDENRPQYVMNHYEAFLLPAFRRQKDSRALSLPGWSGSDEQRQQIVRILHDTDSDLRELRYYAALFDDAAVLAELETLQVELSDWRRRVISNAEFATRMHDAEHLYLERTLLTMDDAAAARAIRRLARDTATGQIAFRNRGLEEAMDGRFGAPLFSADRFAAVLAHTNLLRDFAATQVAAAIARAGRPEALGILLRFVSSSKQKEAVIAAVRETSSDPQTIAAALEHLKPDAAHSDRADFFFDDDPLSEEALSSIWSFEPASSMGVCITAYHADSPHVVIPPRIGRRRVEFITGNLFLRCRDELRSVHFPGTLHDIPAHILDGAQNLEEVTIADGVSVIGTGAFLDCRRAEITLPESVTAIGPYAFEGCASIQLPELPRQLQAIRKGAFENCALLDVPLDGTKLRSIDERAFAGSGLTRLSIPREVSSIGTEAFAGCLCLSSVHISANTAVGPRAFHGCTALRELTAATVGVTLGAQAFCESGLSKVVLPDRMGTIGRGCFAKCSRLTAVTLPKTMKRVPQHAFSGCTALLDIRLPAGLEAIESAAFAKCMSLQKIRLPAALRELGHGAFSECASLRSIEVPKGVRLDEEAFSGCVALARAALPEDLTQIPPECFADCISLHEIEIPPTTTSIGAYAFEGAGLRKVTIPVSVRAIGDGAFSGCTELEEVVFEGTPRIGSHVFSGCPALHHGGLHTV